MAVPSVSLQLTAPHTVGSHQAVMNFGNRERAFLVRKETKELYFFLRGLSLCSLTLEFRNYKYVLKLADINARLNYRVA